MDFLALVNGQQASIIHLDDKGHATVEPIDFLKGHVLLGWAVAGLDQIVTCEESLGRGDELELKYYEHGVLKQTFQLETTTSRIGLTGPYMMFLLPETNYLFVSTLSKDVLVRFDVKTGARKDVTIGSDETHAQIIESYLGPLWDAKEHNLIVQIGEVIPGVSSYKDFLARMNPETFSIENKVSLSGDMPGSEHTFFYQLLSYDPADKSLIFYGQFGWPFTIYDSTGFYRWQMGTGQPKLIMKDYGLLPGLPIGKTNNIAIIDRRYAITTRSLHSGPRAEFDPHTYLLDLQTHGAQMLDMPYLTWPISQDGLHVDRGAPALQSAASDKPKAAGDQWR